VHEGDRGLRDDLERVGTAVADHCDLERFEREMAAAFRDQGLDLDRLDPKEAGTWLAGWQLITEEREKQDFGARLKLYQDRKAYRQSPP
jgi:hypothetical protein